MVPAVTLLHNPFSFKMDLEFREWWWNKIWSIKCNGGRVGGDHVKKGLVSLMWDLRAVWPTGHNSWSSFIHLQHTGFYNI